MELDRIYNEDCLQGMKKLEDKSVDMVLTDIPYGECNNKGHGELRKISKGLADVVSFSIPELISQLSRITRGSIYIFCSIGQVSIIRKAMDDNGMTTRLCIWEKTNPSPMNGQFLWLSSLECCVFGRFSNATFNEFCKSPVWKYPCGSSKIHPTQKPLELFKSLILASSNEGDLVLDPFSGSGTTAIAAKHLNRSFIAFEKNETFYQASIKRLKEETAQISFF